MRKTLIISACLAVLLAAFTALIYCINQTIRELPSLQGADPVPDGRTAAQYLSMGKKFKDIGWPEKSRECFLRAEKLDPSGVGIKAAQFRLARLPHAPVSQEAVELNIKGYNEDSSERAEEIWKKCIEKYPDFEWPYCNLASRYLRDGRSAEAEPLFITALKLNPNYTNALCGMCDLETKRGNKTAARSYLERAERSDPENEYVQSLKQHI